MAQSVQKIIDKKDRTIVDSENQLLDGFDGIEKDIYNSVLKKVRTFDQKDGKIIFDDDTVTGINEINGIVAKSIQGSKYVGKVRDYLRDFETVKQFNFDIHQDVNDLSAGELSDLINPVQRQIVNQTLQNLTGQGVNTNFIDPLREGIFKNIVAGTTITDLEGYLSAFINTNPERMGQFKRYVSQVSRDALNQFDGQVNSRIAEEFGLDAFRYVGSIIEDSRPQCVRWVGLGVITAENLSNELSWAYSNGTGMIPGTTVDNFAVYRGGYNCRHSAIPFKLTKSQKRELEGGGEIPPDETPIPEQKLTINQKNIFNRENAILKLEELGVKKIDGKTLNVEHLNKMIEVIENTPKKSRPTIITDKNGYESITNLKIKRGKNEWMGLSVSMEIFDRETKTFGFEKIVVINSNGFKTLGEMSKKKIEFNKFYEGKTKSKWYFNDFEGSTHYHEVGHIYDTNISTKPEWLSISEKWHKETKIDLLKPGNGEWKGKNGGEAFAEAFAAYFGNNKKGLPEYVVDYFDKNIK